MCVHFVRLSVCVFGSPRVSILVVGQLNQCRQSEAGNKKQRLGGDFVSEGSSEYKEGDKPVRAEQRELPSPHSQNWNLCPEALGTSVNYHMFPSCLCHLFFFLHKHN